ncbi:hypothetical protein HID58_016440 [Brassica napus]|uniref:BnaA04g24410D protein n=3 Tax=Brassica TaxID=3705 RepID=A0A078IFL6_BRANA|nr:hypothetical protein HID58_016440 [Brassica napus]CAF2299942.1 unnamed protein product [Brassica napus]CDY47963.1 BnaA04g24410D [Brassica napus]
MDKTASVAMDKEVVPLPVVNKDEKSRLDPTAVREAIAVILAQSKLRSKDKATKVLVEHDSPAGDGSKPNSHFVTFTSDRSHTPQRSMPSTQSLTVAARSLRSRILSRSGSTSAGASRWATPGHEERPKGFFMNRTPPPPGQSRKWEDWELPCYVTSFLTIVILGVGLNAKPDLSIETWAHQKALERLEAERLAGDSSD